MVKTWCKRKRSGPRARPLTSTGCVVTVDRVLELSELPASSAVKSGRELYPNQLQTASGIFSIQKFPKIGAMNKFYKPVMIKCSSGADFYIGK